ncbi:MAG: Gfo/Idh/MocA family oxidoreductase [Deltaproteobacteria bacterium]|nr:Gfo/Idh/MocA family oxidoreductase [Deltaproteobacteria bacterium]
MKALVVGYGSMGKRHTENLLRLPMIDRVFVHTDAVVGPDNERVERIGSLEDVSADLAVIANETAEHLDTALFLSERRMHLFIEKPISLSLDGIEGLRQNVEKNRLKVSVGYNMRFLGAIQYIKNLIERHVLGELYFARIEAGQWLPLWRPERDFRNTYSAHKKRGGGVSLDLSHEVDYMRYLFGSPLRWKTLKTPIPSLGIDADAVFEGIYEFRRGFIANVHMDYLLKEKRRRIMIEGSEGQLTADLAARQIIIKTHDLEEKIIDTRLFDMDRTYLAEMTDFVSSLGNGKPPFVTLVDGIEALRLLEDGHVQGQ